MQAMWRVGIKKGVFRYLLNIVKDTGYKIQIYIYKYIIKGNLERHKRLLLCTCIHINMYTRVYTGK